MDAYEDLKSLGRGAFANCRLVRRKTDGELLVVKKFHCPMSELSVKERLEIAQEVKLLAHLSHVNIIKFYDNFVEKGVMHILMEYATGGTLDKRIVMRDGEYIDEDQVWEWFVQIVMALRYVHTCNVLHRDLKTQNIMLSGPQQRTVKLGDFGIAKVLGSRGEMANTMVGTPHYLSPELCQGQVYDQKSDVWALGCVLYEMAALRKPFDASNMPAIIFSIMRSKPKPIPSHYSTELQSMVSVLLQPNPADRPNLQEIAKMPVVAHHLQKWRGTCKRLSKPLPTPNASRPARSQPSTPVGSTPGGGFNKPRNPRSSNLNRLLSEEGAGAGGDPRLMNTMSPRRMKAESAMTEAKVMEELAKVRSVNDPEEVTMLLNAMQFQLGNGAMVSGRVWEKLGGAWADIGGFDNAIEAYRRALRARSGNASLGAMEQLGNLLVRRAQQVWAMAKAGDVEGANTVAKDVLERGVSNERGPGATARLSMMALSSKREAGSPAAAKWKQCASSLMMEGLGLLERLCLLGNTAERRALLGSAYKRRAWTGLGDSRKEDLCNAAKAYAEAAYLEAAEAEDSAVVPVSYARLNQLTFEMLASNARDRAKLVEQVRLAETYAQARREADPTDVWLWVQGMDAKCLRWLLEDDVDESEVLAGYREQFAFGANKRVQASVLDQLAFLQEVLGGRSIEEEEPSEAKYFRKQARNITRLYDKLRKDGRMNGLASPQRGIMPTRSFAAQSTAAQAATTPVAPAADGATWRTSGTGNTARTQLDTVSTQELSEMADEVKLGPVPSRSARKSAAGAGAGAGAGATHPNNPFATNRPGGTKMRPPSMRHADGARKSSWEEPARDSKHDAGGGDGGVSNLKEIPDGPQTTVCAIL